MDIPNLQIETSAERVLLQVWWNRAMDPTATADSLQAMLDDSNAPQSAEWRSFISALIRLLEWLRKGSWPSGVSDQEVLRILLKWEGKRSSLLVADLTEVGKKFRRDALKTPKASFPFNGLGI